MASTRTKSALERTGLNLVAGGAEEASRAFRRQGAAKSRLFGAEHLRRVTRSAQQEAVKRANSRSVRLARDSLKTARDAMARNMAEVRRSNAFAIRRAAQSVKDTGSAYRSAMGQVDQAEELLNQTIRTARQDAQAGINQALRRNPNARVGRTTRYFSRGPLSDVQAARDIAADALRDARRAQSAFAQAQANAQATGRAIRSFGEGAYRPVVDAAEANLSRATSVARESAKQALRTGSREATMSAAQSRMASSAFRSSPFARVSSAMQTGLEQARRFGSWFNSATGGSSLNPFKLASSVSSPQGSSGPSWIIRGLSKFAHSQLGKALNPLNPAASAAVKRTLLRNIPGTGTLVSGVKSLAKGSAVGTARIMKAPVSVPAKLLSKEFELIGKGVGKIAGKNMAGRMLSRTFSAGGLAGGLALSSTLDAGLNAYDFFTSSEFKSGNRDNQMTFKINGKSIKTSDESGVMNAIMNNKLEFARTYGTEVAKGIFRAATFGLVGSGDDTFLDRLADPGVEPEGKADDDLLHGKDPRTGKTLTDENGNHLGPRDILALQLQMANADNANKVRTKFARLALGKNYSDEDKKAYVTDAAAVRTTLREMQTERARRLDKLKTFALNPLSDDARLARPFANAVERSEYEQARKNEDMSYLANWANKFYSSRVGGIDAEYDRWVSGLAKLAPAKRVMEENRLAAYKALTGSDIGQDEQLAAAQDAGAKARIDAFNADWSDAELTDARRLDLDPRTLANTPVESAGSAGAGGEN